MKIVNYSTDNYFTTFTTNIKNTQYSINNIFVFNTEFDIFGYRIKQSYSALIDGVYHKLDPNVSYKSLNNDFEYTNEYFQSHTHISIKKKYRSNDNFIIGPYKEYKYYKPFYE